MMSLLRLSYTRGLALLTTTVGARILKPDLPRYSTTALTQFN